MVGYAYQLKEGLDMTLSTSDLFAVVLALASDSLVYVLERRLRRYEGYYDAR
jgi:hypothetical protein